MGGILSAVLPYSFGLFVAIGLIIDLYVFVFKRMANRKNTEQKPVVKPNYKSTTIASGIIFASLMLLTTCILGWLAARAIMKRVDADTASMYAGFSMRFFIAGCLQALCITITAIWAERKETENTIRYVVIPAVYKTLSSCIATEEDVDRVFMIVMPIIDQYIVGDDWSALINRAKKHPEIDGASYLEQVLDVVYSPQKTMGGRSPYAAFFSEAERRAIDIIKVRVFHYPTYDSPWEEAPETP